MKHHIENPHIAGSARAEHADMARELMHRYAKGEDFFVARDAVMAQHGPRIAKLYGKDVAQRAMNALCSYGPHQLSADVREGHSSSLLDTQLSAMDFTYGGRHSYSDDQRRAIQLLETGKTGDAIGFGAIGIGVALLLAWLGWILAAICIGFVSVPALAWGVIMTRIARSPPYRDGPVMTHAEIEAHRHAWLHNLTEKQIRADETRRQREAEDEAQRQWERECRAALSREHARIKRDQKLAAERSSR